MRINERHAVRTDLRRNDGLGRFSRSPQSAAAASGPAFDNHPGGQKYPTACNAEQT